MGDEEKLSKIKDIILVSNDNINDEIISFLIDYDNYNQFLRYEYKEIKEDYLGIYYKNKKEMKKNKKKMVNELKQIEKYFYLLNK